MKHFGKLLLAILLCEGAGILGSLVTVNAVNTWYVTLQKPFFNPPSWIFGPVWTLLYLLMGISLYLLWNEKKTKQKEKTLRFFYIQLFLNAIWSPIFFGLKTPQLGLIVIVLMWGMIVLTIKNLLLVKKTSAYLLYPYLAWVSFATILNLFIVLLN